MKTEEEKITKRIKVADLVLNLGLITLKI